MKTYLTTLFLFAATFAISMPLYAEDASAISAVSSATTSAKTKPNILIIMTDDQGYGDWSITGHPLLKTPHVDQLAGESVDFTNFYVSPACSPTRAAFLTGMHEFRNGVTHTQQPREQLWQGATTLPQLLASAGYRTGIIGKWHLSNRKGFNPTERGFDWSSTNPGGPREHFDPEMIRQKKEGPNKVTREKMTGYREDIFFDDAMRFIEESKDQPFFMFLSTYSPHDPLEAPEEFIAPFRGKVSEMHAKYLGMVANLDYNIGRMMSFLKEKQLDENTIVILMSDNGQTWGLDVYNANMRGCKATIWEGGSRTFAYWRWKGHWPAHQADNLSAHIDMLPTLCELAGVDIPGKLETEIEGHSLKPVLESKEPVTLHEDRMLFHHVGRWPSGLAAEHKYAMAGVRQGNYLLLRSRACDSEKCTTKNFGYQCATLRYVENGQKNAQYTEGNAAFHWASTPPGHWALFEVKKDPGCIKDLAKTEPGRAASMATAYEKWWHDIFPVMIERGGDRELEYSSYLLEKQAEKKKGEDKK